MKKTNEELAIIGALIFVLSISVVIYFSDWTLYSVGDNLPEYMFVNVPTELTEFQQFAILVGIGYDMMPTVAQQFSIGTIHTQLLQTGFSPVILVIFSTFALLGGQMILYTVGMFIKKIHKGSIGNLAGRSHFLHKYHFLVFMIVPFVGILGDAVMLFAGHQRANPVKIIPFLLIGNAVSSARWIFPAVAQLEIGKILGA